MIALQNIIYYNQHSGSYIEFEIEVILAHDYLDESIEVKDSAKAFIDSLMPYILEFGNTIEFPKILLETIEDEDEIDLFLLAPYDKEIRAVLESYLFVRMSSMKMCNYLERQTYEYHHAEAIGKDAMLLCKSLEHGTVLGSISFHELENEFIFFRSSGQ